MAKPSLEVRLHDRRAGTLLRKDNGNLQFRYDKAYVEAGGPPLSVNLPLRAEAYEHAAAPVERIVAGIRARAALIGRASG